MRSYVNQQAMSEVFLPVQTEVDPLDRLTLIQTVENEFANLIIEQYQRTAFELKTKGWSTGQISELFNISERKIKLFIRWHSEHTGEWNPLRRRTAVDVIDISHLVSRANKQ
jgi:hypothetical protein